MKRQPKIHPSALEEVHRLEKNGNFQGAKVLEASDADSTNLIWLASTIVDHYGNDFDISIRISKKSTPIKRVFKRVGFVVGFVIGCALTSAVIFLALYLISRIDS